MQIIYVNNSRSFNDSQRIIIISYLKPYNCLKYLKSYCVKIISITAKYFKLFSCVKRNVY